LNKGVPFNADAFLTGEYDHEILEPLERGMVAESWWQNHKENNGANCLVPVKE
jgi:hypothetical protein